MQTLFGIYSEVSVKIITQNLVQGLSSKCLSILNIVSVNYLSFVTRCLERKKRYYAFENIISCCLQIWPTKPLNCKLSIGM